MLCCTQSCRSLSTKAVAPACTIEVCALHCCAVVLQLSPECVAAAENVDLVVVEGMGRAIETNLYASFSCDSLKLAMVKHPEVGLLYLQQQDGPHHPSPPPLSPRIPSPPSTPFTPCLLTPSVGYHWITQLGQHWDKVESRVSTPPSVCCAVCKMSGFCCPAGQAGLVQHMKAGSSFDLLQLVAFYEVTVLCCRCYFPHTATATTSS